MIATSNFFLPTITQSLFFVFVCLALVDTAITFIIRHQVRVKGLVKAAHHNGKIGLLSARPAPKVKTCVCV